MNSTFKLSVITIHFEDYDSLRFTWESLQPYLDQQEIEWIVIDGNSKPAGETDRELMAIVEQNAHVYRSEPDLGIYDAMNKGIRFVTGLYFLFMNAGDRFSPDFKLADLVNRVDKSKPDMIWGNTNYQYVDGTFAVKKLRSPKWMIYGMPVCHQSVLFLTERFYEMHYDCELKIAADYDLLARALNSGASVALVDSIICEYSAGGLSQTDHWNSLAEENAVRVKNYRIPAWASWVLMIVKFGLWKLNDFSPGLNRSWRRKL